MDCHSYTDRSSISTQARHILPDIRWTVIHNLVGDPSTSKQDTLPDKKWTVVTIPDEDGLSFLYQKIVHLPAGNTRCQITDGLSFIYQAVRFPGDDILTDAEMETKDGLYIVHAKVGLV
ncbi:hypothetical protein ElyMa_005953600 [Elysia marginata]|uniref:Uncharacterized protein n=1 Tax=Elysia marginata TaxID=1093978 RepID=A0AAV4G9N2_9GAST|nr:hypothetical protein ElyMa_005953600 [Elysia marginata]